MAVIHIQSAQDLDWNEACERLAELAESNGKKFKQAVSREANRRYKSRHMAELNKAKKTFEDKGYSEGEGIGRKIGRALGYDQATKEWRISYPCSICGEPIYMKPEDKDTKAAAEHLTSQGWGHSSCHKKQKQKT
jgi:hypothetical protein